MAFSVARPTEAGIKSALPSRIPAYKYSFQAEKKATTATAIRPGIDKGKTILHNTLISVQPSTTAASRTSAGTVSNTPFRIQIQTGKAKAASISEREGKLFNRFNLR